MLAKSRRRDGHATGIISARPNIRPLTGGQLVAGPASYRRPGSARAFCARPQQCRAHCWRATTTSVKWSRNGAAPFDGDTTATPSRSRAAPHSNEPPECVGLRSNEVARAPITPSGSQLDGRKLRPPIALDRTGPDRTGSALSCSYDGLAVAVINPILGSPGQLAPGYLFLSRHFLLRAPPAAGRRPRHPTDWPLSYSAPASIRPARITGAGKFF